MKRSVIPCLVLLACSKPAPTTTSDAAVSEPRASGSVAPAPVVDAAAPVAATDAGPSACPAGMVLVDGDYCTELELKCEQDASWYAEWNDKTICEHFEEPSRCVGKKVHKRFCKIGRAFV